MLSQVWINQGDIILISLRDFQDGKADVIVKYTSDEVRPSFLSFLRLELAFSAPRQTHGRSEHTVLLLVHWLELDILPRLPAFPLTTCSLLRPFLQARNLKTYGELPDTAKINETDTFGDEGDDDGVEFGGDDSDIDDI